MASISSASIYAKHSCNLAWLALADNLALHPPIPIQSHLDLKTKLSGGRTLMSNLLWKSTYGGSIHLVNKAKLRQPSTVLLFFQAFIESVATTDCGRSEREDRVLWFPCSDVVFSFDLNWPHWCLTEIQMTVYLWCRSHLDLQTPAISRCRFIPPKQ